MFISQKKFKPHSVGTLFLLGVFFTFSSIAVAQQQMTPQEQPQQQDAEVSDQELKVFAEIATKVDSINQEANQEMVETVQENDLEVEEYNQLMRQLQSEDDASKLDADEATVEKALETSNEIQRIQTEVNQKTQQTIQQEGLAPDRFDMIMQLVNNDPNVRQRFEEVR